jgi:hypothetical protein
MHQIIKLESLGATVRLLINGEQYEDQCIQEFYINNNAQSNINIVGQTLSSGIKQAFTKSKK